MGSNQIQLSLSLSKSLISNILKYQNCELDDLEVLEVWEGQEGLLDITILAFPPFVHGDL